MPAASAAWLRIGLSRSAVSDLPEFGRPLPGRLAIGFHLVDYAVHGWDVARTIGVPYHPAGDVLAATVEIARMVPDGAERLEPGAAFAPALPVAAGTDPLTEILLRLGRDPARTRLG